MPARDQVIVEIGEGVIERALQKKVPSLRVSISQQEPQVELSISLIKAKCRLAGVSPDGEVILQPLGAAGLLTRLFGNRINGGSNFRLVENRLLIRILPVSLTPPIDVEEVVAFQGWIRLVLRASTEV